MRRFSASIYTFKGNKFCHCFAIKLSPKKRNLKFKIILEKKFDLLILFFAYNLYDLIVLTGDVARNPSIENYNFIMEELSLYGKQILISPGNHDVGYNEVNNRRKIFKRYFKRFYDYKVMDNNLFIALCFTINNK